MFENDITEYVQDGRLAESSDGVRYRMRALIERSRMLGRPLTADEASEFIVSNEIRQIRDKTGLSQSKFASFLGIPVINIQHWEQGVSNPPTYVIGLINKVLEASEYRKLTS